MGKAPTAVNSGQEGIAGGGSGVGERRRHRPPAGLAAAARSKSDNRLPVLHQPRRRPQPIQRWTLPCGGHTCQISWYMY